MVNMGNSPYKVWDHNKTIELISKYIRKSNYNEPNIEGKKWEKNSNLKNNPKKLLE